MMDRALPPQSFARKYGQRIALLLAASMLLLGLLMRYGRADSLFINKDQLTIATVQRGAFQEFLPLTGTTAPIDSVYVDIAEPGQVAEIFVEAGNMVNVGQVLVRLTSTA